MRIALVGGGPSSLFILKRLVESTIAELRVVIFEKTERLGQGMPYSGQGAQAEHITNVSSNELPPLPESLVDWIRRQPAGELEPYGMNAGHLDEDRVVPRLLFGRYLEEQFQRVLQLAEQRGVKVRVHLNATVENIRDIAEERQVELTVNGQALLYDRVVICSGHFWPRPNEGKVPGYYDSPYPPAKLTGPYNHPVALRGSSLTAVDAVRTLSRRHGKFSRNGCGLKYTAEPQFPEFKLVLHTRNGLLPCLRFHLDDPEVHSVKLPDQQQLTAIRSQNDGFVPLDWVFEEYFKKLLRQKDPAMYERIRRMDMEAVVEAATRPREESDSFAYFKAEYTEALASEAKERSIAWKEVLAVLSFALNYPAKYFSAEDMLRLRQSLLPLLSIVIAFIPRSSAEELLALHAAGRLELLEVGKESQVEARSEGGIVYHFEGGERSYQTFVDCIGQPRLELESFPFRGLVEQGVVSQARVRFRSPERARKQKGEAIERDEDGSYHLVIPGMAISDSFQPVDRQGRAHPRVYLMAVPFMGGHNPDYSGLDFCEEASRRIVEKLGA